MNPCFTLGIGWIMMLRAYEMVQRGKELTVKPDNLSSIPVDSPPK